MADPASAALGARAAQALDLFDLSFLISGASLLPLLAIVGVNLSLSTGGLAAAVAALVASAVAGMVLFALGRFLRTRMLANVWPLSRLDYRGLGFNGLLADSIARHGLDTDPAVVAAADEPARVYVRWWAELREDSRVRESYSLIRRYWVLAATYDGLGASALVWAMFLGLGNLRGSPLTATLAVVPVLASYVCFREATRFGNHQVEELCATIAYLREAQASADRRRQEDLELWRTRPCVIT